MLRTTLGFFVVTATIVSLYILTYQKPLVTQQPYYTRLLNNTKYILFWNNAGSSDRLYFPSTGSELFESCPFKDCFATSDRNLLPIEDFDAIIFHSPKTGPKQKETVPKRRRPEQRYIFAAFEAPSRFFVNRSRYVLDDFYNWTMTYRFDSDLVRRHGYVEKGAVEYEMPSREFVRGKGRMVAWMVSNCNTPGKRELLAKELSKYVNVDVYGRCGNFSCSKSVNQDCLEMIERNYKYYLSFENSHCRDYTTEKLFNILEKNIIPIVYGGGVYKEIAPPNSHINVEDFSDAKSLAEHLKTIARNESTYLSYFEWKKRHKVVKNTALTMCELCKMLHNPNETYKVYHNITNWWFDSKTSKCLNTPELPPIIQNLL